MVSFVFEYLVKIIWLASFYLVNREELWIKACISSC